MAYAVYLAKETGKSSKREKYAYGMAATTVGFAAMAAYLYMQKRQ